MKKLLVSLLAAAAVACTPCSGFSASKHGSAVKIADYLYEITYDDLAPTPKETGGNLGLCSSVRYGNFHGRNLDFIYSEFPEFVVHTKASGGRLASVAVCTARITQKDFDKGLATEKLYDSIPHTIVDGINEKGVAMNVNVVYADDTGHITGTNPGKPDLHAQYALRYMLDRAVSAEHAVGLLREVNLHGSLGRYAFHYMISDEKETYIVEIINNKIVAVKQNIMTNFVNSRLPEFNDHAMGIERYLILASNIAQGGTVEGMCDLMRKVKYSAFSEPGFAPMWYSEFYEFDITKNTPAEKILPLIKEHNEKVAAAKREDADPDVWITINTSVYDLKNRKLHLHVQEDYAHAYEFGVEGK